MLPSALFPTKLKFGLILGFLNRAKRISSFNCLFDKDVSKLKKNFLNNGYPSYTYVNKFFKKSKNISFENGFCTRIWVGNHIIVQIIFLNQ